MLVRTPQPCEVNQIIYSRFLVTNMRFNRPSIIIRKKNACSQSSFKMKINNEHKDTYKTYILIIRQRVTQKLLFTLNVNVNESRMLTFCIKSYVRLKRVSLFPLSMKALWYTYLNAYLHTIMLCYRSIVFPIRQVITFLAQWKMIIPQLMC